MGSLQHLGGDRWRVKVYTTKGHQVSRSFRASGERAAKRKQADVESALRTEHAKREAEHAKHRGSIAELVDDWLRVKARTTSESTMPAYLRHGQAIKARFGRMPVAGLTGADIDRWYGDLKAAGATDAGIAVTHRHLRAVLRFGYKRRSYGAPATDHAEPGSHRTPKPRPPRPDAVRAMIAALPVTERAWARAVALLALTGMRRGEVVGLRWADWDGTDLWVQRAVVEVKGKTIVRPFPKGKEPRPVLVESVAAEILATQRASLEAAGVDSPWVFPDITTDTTGGSPRRPGWVSLMWGRHRAEVGAVGWGLHQLRHAYAVMLLSEGVPVNTVQALLGHAKASTTIDVYGNTDQVGEQRAREVVRLALSPAP